MTTSPFTIRTTGPGEDDWTVFAEWYGQLRPVHGPTDVFDACQWARAAEREQVEQAA